MIPVNQSHDQHFFFFLTSAANCRPLASDATFFTKVIALKPKKKSSKLDYEHEIDQPQKYIFRFILVLIT